MENWSFSPLDMLRAERERIDNARSDVRGDQFLAVYPGKQLLPIAARAVEMTPEAYVQLIHEALGRTGDGPLQKLGLDWCLRWKRGSLRERRPSLFRPATRE